MTYLDLNRGEFLEGGARRHQFGKNFLRASRRAKVRRLELVEESTSWWSAGVR